MGRGTTVIRPAPLEANPALRPPEMTELLTAAEFSNTLQAFSDRFPTFKEALTRARSSTVVIGFPREGTFYDSTTNLMTVDPKDPRYYYAFVHETYHLHCDQTPDLRVDPDTHANPDEYVGKMIDEETQAQFLSIQAYLEMDRYGAAPALFQKYVDGFNAGFKQVLEREGKWHELGHHAETLVYPQAKTSEAILKKARREGIKVGKARIRQAIVNGEVVTSTTRQAYPAYHHLKWRLARAVIGDTAITAPTLREQDAFNCGLYAVWMGIEALTQQVDDTLFARIETSARSSARMGAIFQYEHMEHIITNLGYKAEKVPFHDVTSFVQALDQHQQDAILMPYSMVAVNGYGEPLTPNEATEAAHWALLEGFDTTKTLLRLADPRAWETSLGRTEQSRPGQFAPARWPL